MANNKIKIEKWFDVDSMIRWTKGTYRGCIDWESNKNKKYRFKYGDIEGYVKILDKIDKDTINIEYEGKKFSLKIYSLKQGKLGMLFGVGGITKEIMKKQKEERINEIKYNKYGTKMQIIKYTTEDNLIVRFNDDIRTDRKITYRDFNENLSSPLDKTICGIGYIGIGKYKPTIDLGNRKTRPTKEYDAWRSMLRRCYANLEISKSYRDCTVDEKWHNFQNYAKWYEENFYQFKDEVMTVDKDILHKGNRIYSEDNCLIVPNCINCMFVKNKDKRGNLPIGVYHHKRGYYRAECSDMDLGYQQDLGEYDNPIDAFNAYKQYKENYIKRKANDFKDLIPKKLYEAMINYKIDITD